MSEIDALKFLQGEISKRVESFDAQRQYYRKSATYLALATAFLSALTTFLIGVGQIYQIKILSVVALAISSLMTVLTVVDSLYTYRRRWIQSNDTLMQLYELRSRIKYSIALQSELPLEQIEKFYEQYQLILRQSNESWKSDRVISD